MSAMMRMYEAIAAYTRKPFTLQLSRGVPLLLHPSILLTISSPLPICLQRQVLWLLRLLTPSSRFGLGMQWFNIHENSPARSLNLHRLLLLLAKTTARSLYLLRCPWQKADHSPTHEHSSTNLQVHPTALAPAVVLLFGDEIIRSVASIISFYIPCSQEPGE